MSEGIEIQLHGEQRHETAAALAQRLLELGRQVDRGEHGLRITDRDGEPLSVELSPYDTPDFAAEKILDTLAEQGVVDLEAETYSPEQEEEIRKRLSDLGYIE